MHLLHLLHNYYKEMVLSYHLMQLPVTGKLIQNIFAGIFACEMLRCLLRSKSSILRHLHHWGIICKAPLKAAVGICFLCVNIRGFMFGF